MKVKQRVLQRVLQILNNNLGNASDNLYRATSAFRRYSEEQLNEEYGESGYTRKEILQQRRVEVKRAKECIRECIRWAKRSKSITIKGESK